VFCVVSSYIKKLLNNRLVKGYYRHVLKISKEVSINFGITKSDELSSWNSGIELLDEWSFYDTYTDKLKFFKINKFLESLRKTDWIVHYKLI